MILCKKLIKIGFNSLLSQKYYIKKIEIKFNLIKSKKVKKWIKKLSNNSLTM